MMLTLSLSDPDQPKLEMAVIMSLESEVTSITGVVSDERSGAVIENATIEMDYFEIKRFSDNEGNFAIADLPPGDYELLFTAEDYLPLIEAVSIAEGDDDIELNIEMLQAVFGINVDDLAREVAPDEQIEIGFTVSNSGNGTLEFSTVRSLAGGADADPWTLRQSINVGEILDDTRINGVLYIDELYYIAGGHNREPVIYIMNTDGQEEGVIELDTEDNTGMRDLAFDGELIWGAIGNLVIGMTLEGEVIHSWESPYNPTNNITWDTDRNVLWLCSTTSDPIAFDREGNQIEDLVVDHLDYRIYGLSYWEDEPEGYPLILFCKDRETDMQLIVKCDPEGGGDGDGDLQNVTFLEPEAGGTPAGSYITNTFDIYSWVLICNSNNAPNAGGDRIDIWQLDTRMSWFMLDQEEGSIDPGDELNLTLTLDATEIPPAQFEGLITFIHNGVGDDVEIPVFMNVILGPVHSSRTLELNFGWNMVSTNLQPDEDGIVELTRNLVEDDLLILIKDGIGRFYNPEYGYNNIPGWEVANGYLVKMADAGSLELEGTTVLFNDPIDLTEGWQMISYFPRDPVNAITALSGLEDNLVMAKDGQGRFYNREYGYSNMVDMCEGSGYLVKVNENAELVYRLRIPDEDENVGPMEKNAVKPTASQNFPAPTPTASNMSILVLNPDGIDAEIGVFAGDILVGSGIIRDDLVGISVWGDDPTTEALDGALQNQNLEIQLFQETSEFSFQMDWVEGEAKYSINEFAVLSITTDQQAPVEFGLLAPHPNPFNSRIKLSYSLTRSGEVNLSIFDLSGREIDNIVTGNQTAGHYSINWEAASQASGVYLVRFEAESRTQSRKIVLVERSANNVAY
ncbi:carboxypeptidase regulatory-like domain-containing protein [bacterium]|nr:carboxypeptidase regulatory-like domain-containing protein [bacterium]